MAIIAYKCTCLQFQCLQSSRSPCTWRCILHVMCQHRRLITSQQTGFKRSACRNYESQILKSPVDTLEVLFIYLFWVQSLQKKTTTTKKANAHLPGELTLSCLVTFVGFCDPVTSNICGGSVPDMRCYPSLLVCQLSHLSFASSLGWLSHLAVASLCPPFFLFFFFYLLRFYTKFHKLGGVVKSNLQISLFISIFSSSRQSRAVFGSHFQKTAPPSVRPIRFVSTHFRTFSDE